MLPGLDTNVTLNLDEGVTALASTSENVDESAASPPLDDMIAPLAPTSAVVDEAPRHSTWVKVPIPSQEETKNGLVHGRAIASQRVVADVAVEGTVSACAPENSLAETEEDMLLQKVIDEIILLVDVEDPDTPSWTEALESGDRDKWLEGAEAELNSLCEMGVYKLIPRSEVPTNQSVLQGKFICWLKRNEIGDPVRHKVRWVAKGFQQVWGRDFSKMTSPTTRLESLRVILHIAAANDWCIRQY